MMVQPKIIPSRSPKTDVLPLKLGSEKSHACRSRPHRPVFGSLYGNLISITDGQIYLDSSCFERDQRPAFDIGRSVSRIGGVAQSPRMRKAAKNLKILLSCFQSLEWLSRVGLEMDVGMQDTIRRGKTLRELLRQGRLQHRDLFEQSVALTAVDEDWLAGLPTRQVRPFVEELCRTARLEMKDLVDRLSSGELLADDWQTPIAEWARVVSARFDGAGQFSPMVTRVLPIRPARPAEPLRRTHYQSYRRLAAVAVREFLYTTLHELLVDSLASEHGMRLLAAESARQWLEDTAETVRRQLSACRREATTQEVLDIVAGAKPRQRGMM